MDLGGAHILGGKQPEQDSVRDVQRLLDQAYSQGKRDGHKQATAELMLDPSRIRRVFWEDSKHVLFLDTRQFTPMNTGYVRVFLGDPHVTAMDTTSALPDSAVLLWEEDYAAESEPVQLHDGVQAPVVGGPDDQPRDQAPVDATPEADDQVPQFELMIQADPHATYDAVVNAWNTEAAKHGKEQVPGTRLDIELKTQGVHGYQVAKGMVRNVKPQPVDKVWWASIDLEAAEAFEDMITGMARQGMVPHTEPNFAIEWCEAHKYGQNAPGEDAYRVMGTFVNAAELRLYKSRMEATSDVRQDTDTSGT